MTLKYSFFDFGFSFASLVDIGRRRTSNQDEVIICPQTGFFAVSDGMGGLPYGGKTSQLIQQKLPGIMEAALHELNHKGTSKNPIRHAELVSVSPRFQGIADQVRNDDCAKSIVLRSSYKPTPENAAKILAKQVGKLSDTIYNAGNTGSRFNYGATLSGVWLTGRHALFVNLGDSRGYILPRRKRNIRQITEDHNRAAWLVQRGEITKEEARFHPASARLTRFMGMNPPVSPDVFICDVHPGDKILLCSDGLHGMIGDTELPLLMRSSQNPALVCKHLAAKANANGGRDNIAVMQILIKN